MEARVEAIILEEDPTIASIKGLWRETGRQEVLGGMPPEDRAKMEKGFLEANSKAMKARPTERLVGPLPSRRRHAHSKGLTLYLLGEVCRLLNVFISPDAQAHAHDFERRKGREGKGGWEENAHSKTAAGQVQREAQTLNPKP